MIRADVIKLVSETRSAHGVHETITESMREVPAEIRSVTRREYYDALNAGITPEIVFKLTLDADYQGESVLRYGGKKYRVVRTYLTNDGGIEITAERSDENGEDEEPEEDDDSDTDDGNG